MSVRDDYPLIANAIRDRNLTAAERTRYIAIGVGAFAGVVALAIAIGLKVVEFRFLGNTTDWVVVAILAGFGPFSYYQMRELRRVQSMDEKFPNFLRDLSDLARAGMTLPRALVTVAQSNYGALTPEVEKMRAQVEWGINFADAFARFGVRVKTPLIKRTVSLVIEAQRSGGNVVDVLSAAADDAREIQQLVRERHSQLSAYSLVIYVAFFVFLAVALILVTQFIPPFEAAVADSGPGIAVGGLQFTNIDGDAFTDMFLQASVIQAIGGGLIGGVLTQGTPWAGLRNSGVMIVCAWIAFRAFT